MAWMLLNDITSIEYNDLRLWLHFAINTLINRYFFYRLPERKVLSPVDEPGAHQHPALRAG